ncbi:hypothetical protein [Mucilaginibacter sp. OK098]|uniref:hypothetical protein n=1 Tax=Mucilaginibacter sp. OK098 TaxID=1855297 RepID=UPI000923CB4A|nr:hypothetical protein [Mucilaginibacter sp. OK098]SHM96179.1 hypothetical protein SAMN05216524_104304 [Mucilaginibacter sp. OK098]
MESIVISPKTKDEAKLITDLLQKMNISSKIITDEEKEDMGLVIMMKETDMDDLVSREEIMQKLRS